MFYVYEWYDCDTGEIFYVGKGCGRRYKVRKHNALFNYFISTRNCASRIVKTFDFEEFAFAYEYVRINELKEKGQCICNIRKGGFGGVTTWWDNSRREEYSKHNVMKIQNQRERMSKNNPMKIKEIAKVVAAKKSRPIILDGIEYLNAVEIAKKYNRSENSVQQWAKRGYSPIGQCCYYKDCGEKKGWETLYQNRHRRVRRIRIDGIEFESVESGAIYLNCNATTVIRHIRSKKPFNGHICEYVNQQPSRANFDNSSAKGSTTNK